MVNGTFKSHTYFFTLLFRCRGGITFGGKSLCYYILQQIKCTHLEPETVVHCVLLHQVFYLLVGLPA